MLDEASPMILRTQATDVKPSEGTPIQSADELERSEDSMDPLPSTSEEILPEALQTLTVTSENTLIRSQARALLDESRAAALQDIILMNRQKTHWFSKQGGEGRTNPIKRRRSCGS